MPYERRSNECGSSLEKSGERARWGQLMRVVEGCGENLAKGGWPAEDTHDFAASADNFQCIRCEMDIYL